MPMPKPRAKKPILAQPASKEVISQPKLLYSCLKISTFTDGFNDPKHWGGKGPSVICINDNFIYIADDLMVVDYGRLNVKVCYKVGAYDDVDILTNGRLGTDLIKFYAQKMLRSNEDYDLPPMLRIKFANLNHDTKKFETFIEIPFDARTLCKHMFDMGKEIDKNCDVENHDITDEHVVTSTAVYCISNDKEFVYGLVYGREVKSGP